MSEVDEKRAMIALSTRAKEAIKTALAITIAMGIALWMDWEKPYWAGFAVAFISLPMEGQSLNQGAMRMLGTLVACAVALTFLAWFPQERWWFMVVVSLYVGFCAYMMTGPKRQYFWYASGFICIVIEAWVWALLYLYHPLITTLPDLETAFYFSIVTFTTLGYGDVVLTGNWRTLASIQAANGVIVFGWTTALLFVYIQRVYKKE